MMAMSSNNHTGGGGVGGGSTSTLPSTSASRDASFNKSHGNSAAWEEEQHRQRQQQQQQRAQQHSSTEERHHASPPQREPFFRFLSSPNIHHRSANGGLAIDEPVRVKIESQANGTSASTSPPTSNGHGGGMANYSYSAMARLSIAGEGKEGGDRMQDSRLPSIRANGDYGMRDEQSRYAEQKLNGGRRSPSRSGESSPNLVSVKEIQDRERYDDVGLARAKRRSGLMSPTNREDGMISLPPLRHGFVPSSPGSRSGNGSVHNHSESSGYARDEGGRVTGPQRTGRPHSQSVSSMINSPYSSYSATPSATSLLLPSPSGLSLRPSFAYSPPRSSQALPGSANPRASDFPRLERHISSSSLPGETSTTNGGGFLRPHHSFFPNGGLNSMFSSKSGDSTPHHNGDPSTRPRSPPADSDSPAPAATTARRGNIERLFRAATTRKKRSSSDATKTKAVLTMTEIKDELDDQLDGIPGGDGKDGKDMDPSAVRRLAHLQCEQRRRESINGGFATLRSILPETTAADSKAAILQKAINYIQNLEQAVRVSGGRLDPSMTQTPSAPSHIRAARRKRGSTLSNSFSEATGVYAGGAGEGESMLGLEGQTARSSATDLQDMGRATNSSRGHGDEDGDGDDTMRMDMDVQDDMAMAMSDDEVDDRRRSFQRHQQQGGSQGQSHQHQQQRQHEGSYSHHPQHQPSSSHYSQQHDQARPDPPAQPSTTTTNSSSSSHPVPPSSTPSSNGGPRKGGFSPLDLLVGVAEQARRVTGGGGGTTNGSRFSLDQQQQQQQHQAQQQQHHQQQQQHQQQHHVHHQMGLGSGMDPKGTGKNGSSTGTRGSWAHIEVGDRR